MGSIPLIGADDISFSNIAATTADFTLRGGLYGVTVNATFGGGSVTLTRKSIDGSTYVTCLTAFTAAGYATVNLPDGTFRISITTATGVYVEIKSIAVSEE
jgi:hypothetical protein